MKQNYLIIEDNIVTNIVIWDGGSDWTPPVNSIQLVQSTISAKSWAINADKTDYELVEFQGTGSIGYTWDGVILTTNLEKPAMPIQPETSNITTI